VLVIAVFCGSTLWWLILTGAMGAVRRRWLSGGDDGNAGLDGRRMRVLNALSGAVLIAFGVLALMHAVL
ncbi:MAG: hypothetical protein WBA46_02550, partial [Thermomicrobiales bacterium]